MRVVGLPEFQRCVATAVGTATDVDALADFYKELAADHESAGMRAASIHVEGTDIQLWATRPIRLSSGEYRVTWPYEERDDERVVVCFALAEF